MSIRPHHVRRIYDGTKLYEFRRMAAGIRSGYKIFIYETAPTSIITGEMDVAAVVKDRAEVLSTLESDPVEREHVRSYLDGALNPIALRIGEIVRYKNPRELSSLAIRRAPQSYQFVRE